MLSRNDLIVLTVAAILGIGIMLIRAVVRRYKSDTGGIRAGSSRQR